MLRFKGIERITEIIISNKLIIEEERKICLV